MNALPASTQSGRQPQRNQRTIRQPAIVRGVGFFTNADVTLTLLPAAENHGLVFQRTDCRGTPLIPADIDYVIERPRRTALAAGGATVELTEHVLAALYGLQIDNCLIQLDGPEPPGCDGSSQRFVDVLIDAQIVEQTAPRQSLAVEADFHVEENGCDIASKPLSRPALAIGYELDYRDHSPIPRQRFNIEITPDTFVSEIAFARTFVLESEVRALRSAGFGLRVTERDLLVFQENGEVLGNQLRTSDECARHKILDCLGDFALIGCDLYGHFNAFRSGHKLNRDVIKRLRQRQRAGTGDAIRRAA